MAIQRNLYLNTMSFSSLLNRTSLDKYRANSSQSAKKTKSGGMFMLRVLLSSFERERERSHPMLREYLDSLRPNVSLKGYIFTLGPSFKSPRV